MPALSMSDPPAPPHVRYPVPGALHRAAASVWLHAVDRGLTTRTPLKTHLVVCGFPRAGSTLLSLILQTAYRGAKAFPKERAAASVAYLTDRDQTLLISKRPNDIFFLDDIRRIYRWRRPRVRFILTMRDPRAILTSVHAGRRGTYYVSPQRWLTIYRRIEANRSRGDCLLVRYEDLVSNVGDVQTAIGEFIGEPPEVGFDRFLEHVPPEFQQTALNGLRALDPSAVLKWRESRHRARIRALLRQIPNLPQILIDTGYERDERWVDEYEGTPLRAAPAITEESRTR